MTPVDIRSIILSTHAVHHSQYSDLKIHLNSGGYSASFYNAVPGTDLATLESKLSSHPKLADYKVLVYRRDTSVIARMHKHKSESSRMVAIPRPGSSLRTQLKHTFRDLFNLDKDHYFLIDAYSLKKSGDWMVVFYACEIDLQYFRDRLNASEYFGNYSIKFKNDNVYIRLANPELSKTIEVKPIEVIEPVVKPVIKNSTVVSEFVQSLLSGIDSYGLTPGDLSTFMIMCSSVLSKDATIAELDDLAYYVDRKLQISVI